MGHTHPEASWNGLPPALLPQGASSTAAATAAPEKLLLFGCPFWSQVVREELGHRTQGTVLLISVSCDRR